jgi:hypothetical protein
MVWQRKSGEASSHMCYEPLVVTPTLPADRRRSILGFPWELFEYQRFVDAEARTTRARNDMFADDCPRFEPRPEDVLLALDDIVVTPTKQGVNVRSGRASTEVKLDGLSQLAVTQMLSLMDGTRTAAEIGWQGPGLARLLRGSFGVLVFAPAAVEALERELSGTEATRFPSSPYAIARPYWDNMVGVRRAVKERLRAVLGDPERAVEFLCELHVIATMGESLDSFYKPSSPVSDAGVMPGALWNVTARMTTTPSGTLFLNGPRARVHAVAGELYHRMLYAQVGDPAASEPERTFVDDDGLGWGRVMVARAAHDESFADWYCLPRPLESAHFERLFGELEAALSAAERGDAQVTIEHAARFHWRYVHLHPFRCANQCLAMNLVNFVLAQVLPSGIPHLVLDQLSLRLAIGPYVRLFSRAVDNFVISDPNPALRYRWLREKKQLAFSAMRRVGDSKSEAAALEELRAHPDEAQAALLEVS